ncbi:hypothetical protein M758_8G138900 [Ceratodon purpureus]|nr:hypothetical protein M758_8G138900 [Ceratodon purpureus]
MQMEFRSSDEPQQLLDHLHKTPGLTRLDMELMDMNDVEGKKIGEAVAALESLETLVLKLDAELDEEKKSSPDSLWPMDAFLTAAFLGENPNSSVRSLIIAGSGTDGDIMRLGLLPRVIEQVPLKELVFKWHGDDGAAPEEMHVLLDALVENNSIESLTLPNLVRWDFPDNADNGFIDGEIFAKIVELVKKKTTSIQKMLLHIGECRGKGADTVNLDAFYGALSSNSSLRSLTLKGPFYTPIAETQFPTWIRNTTSLKELLLEGDGDDSEVPKILFQALGENKSLTRLEMEDFFIEDEEVEELLKALKVNSTLQEIIFEPKCDREEEVQEALAKNHQVQL